MHRFLYIIIFAMLTGPVMASGIIQGLQLLIDQELYDQAVRSGERLLEQNEANADIEFLTAYAYQMNRQYRKAASHYQRLIRQHPELPEPRNNLAIIHLSNGDYNKASELLVEAITTHRSYATAYKNLNSIYTEIASQAYRRAVSESSDSVNYANKIELSALKRLTPFDHSNVPSHISEPIIAEAPPLSPVFTELVTGWAQAWSAKDADAYLSYYSSDYKLNFATHKAWSESRRQNFQRPDYSNIGISNIQLRAQTPNLAIIDFEQSFESAETSDKLIKRFGLIFINSQWKITDEQVLSVL